MSTINPITSKLYTEEFKKFKQNEKFFSIPMFQPDIVSEFKKKFQESEILILEAQTGAGKSVVAPYHVAEMYGFRKKIAMSEPRTVNAINIANTLSRQVDSKVGEYVGYMIGKTSGDAKTSKDTKITVMTDAILFQKMLEDIEQYDVIIIDEFHERNVNIDMCLGIIRKYLKMIKTEREYWEWKDSLKSLSPQERFNQEVLEYNKTQEYNTSLELYEEFGFRKPRDYKNPVKFLLLSATIYVDKYLQFYKEFTVSHMFVAGRSYPITDIFIEDVFTQEEIKNNPDQLLDKLIDKLFENSKISINVLVFLPGKADIIDSISRYTGKYEGILVGGIYRGAPEKEVDVLINATKYKELGYKGRLLFATNIAETGVTIDGLEYVIETGTEKKIINKNGYEELLSKNITKGSAKQRCGRVGRTTPGTCYHMYSRKTFEEFKGLGRPAIYDENLDNLFIKLLDVVEDSEVLIDFLINDIPDTLSRDDLAEVVLKYYQDGIIINNKISTTGRFVNSLNVDYIWAILIVTAFYYNIGEIIVPIVAVLSGCSTLKDYFVNKKKIEYYRNSYGDPIAAFNIFNDMIKDGQLVKNDDFIPSMAKETLRKVKEISDKINDYVKKTKEVLKKETNFSVWKMPIGEQFKGENLYKVSDKVISVFAEVFKGRLVFIPYERIYKSLDDNKVSPFDIGATVDLSQKPSLIGYNSLLKVGNRLIPSFPFVILKKENLD